MRVKGDVPRPRVGVSAVPRDVPTGYGGDRADTVAAGLVTGVVAAGGVPVVLPVVPPEVAAGQVEAVDALVLSGGQDLVGADGGAGRWVDPARDLHEAALWQAARDAGVPVLGICRGLQLVNVALGGTLITHVEGHDAGAGHLERTHAVRARPGSALADVLGAGGEVNTIHHQVIERLGAGLAASGWSPEGLVEAAEDASGAGWFLGVQWHPELMLERPGGQGLFDALVGAVRRG